MFASPVSDPALRRAFQPVDFTADVTPLTEAEIQVLKLSCAVAGSWRIWRGSGWHGECRMPILYKLRPTYDLATFTYEGFLEELLHRYRAQHRFID